LALACRTDLTMIVRQIRSFVEARIEAGRRRAVSPEEQCCGVHSERNRENPSGLTVEEILLRGRQRLISSASSTRGPCTPNLDSLRLRSPVEKEANYG
jgi:hypothetical protein